MYEKKAVMLYLAQSRGLPAKNPNAGAYALAKLSAATLMHLLAGVNVPLTAAELQPARNVMRLARRKQLASQQVCFREPARRRLLTSASQGRVSDVHEDVDVIE